MRKILPVLLCIGVLPALEAYNVINAEFPNGVVETFNGTFSPSDQALYNDNYNKMKNIA